MPVIILAVLNFLFLVQVKANKRYAGSSKWTVKVSFNMLLKLILGYDEDNGA